MTQDSTSSLWLRNWTRPGFPERPALSAPGQLAAGRENRRAGLSRRDYLSDAMTSGMVILREICDESGSRSLFARLEKDGTLTIEGHDLGKGVEQFFGPGNREYEWVWTIQSRDVPRLKAALHCSDDLLAALGSRFSNHAAVNLKPFLDENGIPYEAWSRIGE